MGEVVELEIPPTLEYLDLARVVVSAAASVDPDFRLRTEERELPARSRHVVTAAPTDEASITGVAQHALETKDTREIRRAEGRSLNGIHGDQVDLHGQPAEQAFFALRAVFPRHDRDFRASLTAKPKLAIGLQ